jgi:hypothetical protein
MSHFTSIKLQSATSTPWHSPASNSTSSSSPTSRAAAMPACTGKPSAPSASAAPTTSPSILPRKRWHLCPHHRLVGRPRRQGSRRRLRPLLQAYGIHKTFREAHAAACARPAGSKPMGPCWSPWKEVRCEPPHPGPRFPLWGNHRRSRWLPGQRLRSRDQGHRGSPRQTHRPHAQTRAPARRRFRQQQQQLGGS